MRGLCLCRKCAAMVQIDGDKSIIRNRRKAWDYSELMVLALFTCLGIPPANAE